MAAEAKSTFRCTGCGLCCHRIRQPAEPGLRAVLERSQGVNGFYFLPDTRHAAPYLFEWELAPLARLAEEHGVRFPTFPRHVFADARLRRVLVMEWAMGFEDCPYHVEDRCAVYPHRPLICRQYPVIDLRAVSRRCPEVLAASEGLEGEAMDLWMERAYGESNAHARHAHDVLQHNYGLVARLCREGALWPAVGWDLRNVRRLAGRGVTGLFAYLAESGRMDEGECRGRLEALSTPSGARRLLDEMG